MVGVGGGSCGDYGIDSTTHMSGGGPCGDNEMLVFLDSEKPVGSKCDSLVIVKSF